MKIAFHSLLLVTSAVVISACSSGSSGSKNPASPLPATQPSSSSDQSPSSPSDQKNVSTAPSSSELSDHTTIEGVTIKRMGFGDNTMETLEPDSSQTASSQSGILTLALCMPSFDNEHLDDLSRSAYPIVIGSDSQVVLHRDQDYKFGDGTTGEAEPAYALLTCRSPVRAEPADADAKPLAATAQVEIKHLHFRESVDEAFDPNPKTAGAAATESPVQVQIVCAARLTDATAASFRPGNKAFTMTEGSQLFLRRSPELQSALERTRAKSKPTVIVTCSK